MKKIGYIYRYNEEEGKGILVYGYNRYVDSIQYRPIIFDIRDTITDVCSGQLVYFEHADYSAQNIERASLANFRRDIISEISSSYRLDKENGDNHAIIRFENLHDIKVIKPKTNNEHEKESIDKKESDKLEDNLIDSTGRHKPRFAPNRIDLDVFGGKQHHPSEDLLDLFDDEDLVPLELPNSIDDLYSIFGHYQHDNNKEGLCSVDILDISYWIDEEIVANNNFYGANSAEQVVDLYRLFENWFLKRSCVEQTDRVSVGWKYILAANSEKELRIICQNIPDLQPKLPIDFSLNNLDVLTPVYNFPSIGICETFLINRVRNTLSTSEYITLNYSINNALSCEIKHKGDTVHLCQLGKEKLQELSVLLEKQYQTKILKKLKSQINQISSNTVDGDSIVNGIILKHEKDYLKKLGSFVDQYLNIISNIHYFWHAPIDDFIDSYNGLSEVHKELFYSLMKDKVNECAIFVAKQCREFKDPGWLDMRMKELYSWLDEKTVSNVKDIVNQVFSQLDELEDLKDAYDGHFITEEQYLSQYIIITKDYSLEQFLKSIDHNYDVNDMPLSIQKYIIEKIFRLFSFEDLSSSNYVLFGNKRIRNMRELIEWLRYDMHSILDEDIVNSTIEHMIKNLNNAHNVSDTL